MTMERRTNENEETREFDHTDFYQMYQDEMDCIVPCTAQEMEELSEELLNGSDPSLPLPQAYRNKNFLILQGFSCFFYASFV